MFARDVGTRREVLFSATRNGQLEIWGTDGTVAGTTSRAALRTNTSGIFSPAVGPLCAALPPSVALRVDLPPATLGDRILFDVQAVGAASAESHNGSTNGFEMTHCSASTSTTPSSSRWGADTRVERMRAQRGSSRHPCGDHRTRDDRDQPAHQLKPSACENLKVQDEHGSTINA